MSTPEGHAKSAQRPEDLHHLFVAAVNAHDVEALLALYEDQATAADLEGHSIQGKDTLRTFLLSFLATVKQIEGTTRKAMMAGDIALLSSTWRADFAGQDGSVASVPGTSAEVARRQPDGTWRFLIDDPQFVDRTPPV